MSIADFELACGAIALHVYPVKACAGVAVTELVLDARGGAAGDREWAIVDADGAVTWQGAHPRLALVHPRVTPAGLRLASPGVDEIGVPAGPAPCRGQIWNDLGAPPRQLRRRRCRRRRRRLAAARRRRAAAARAPGRGRARA